MRNDEGFEVSPGLDYSCKHLLYCGRFLGTRAIPGSDGRCGIHNGPQCASCRRSFRYNDEGDEVSLGTDGKCRHLLYCGRYKGTRAIPGSDGRCGPNNGPQCASCRRSFNGQNSENSSEEEEEEFENDEGVRVDVGNNLTLYCGRFLGRRAIPGSDGRCGPNNGPQCASCRRSFPADSNDDDDSSDGSIYWDSDSEDGTRYVMRKTLCWMERRSIALQTAIQLKQRRQRRDLRAQQLERQEMQNNHREFMSEQIRKIEDMKSKLLDHTKMSSKNFDKFCQGAAKELSRLEIHKRSKKSIAVLGPSGVGKSTVINAFAGKHVTEIGLAECTDEVSMVYGEGPFDFYDVPGSHDARADFYKIETLHKLKSLHMVFLVYESRIDHAAKVAKLMVSINMPFIVVRNKCDFTQYPPEEWEACKDQEMTKLKVYTKVEPPLVFLGMSQDPHNGAEMEGLSELRSLMEAVMEIL